MPDKDRDRALMDVGTYFLVAVLGVLATALPISGADMLLVTIVVLSLYQAVILVSVLTRIDCLVNLPTDACVFAVFWVGVAAGPIVRQDPTVAWAVRSIMNIVG